MNLTFKRQTVKIQLQAGYVYSFVLLPLAIYDASCSSFQRLILASNYTLCNRGRKGGRVPGWMKKDGEKRRMRGIKWGRKVGREREQRVWGVNYVREKGRADVRNKLGQGKGGEWRNWWPREREGRERKGGRPEHSLVDVISSSQQITPDDHWCVRKI